MLSRSLSSLSRSRSRSLSLCRSLAVPTVSFLVPSLSACVLCTSPAWAKRATRAFPFYSFAQCLRHFFWSLVPCHKYRTFEDAMLGLRGYQEAGFCQADREIRHVVVLFAKRYPKPQMAHVRIVAKRHGNGISSWWQRWMRSKTQDLHCCSRQTHTKNREKRGEDRDSQGVEEREKNG